MITHYTPTSRNLKNTKKHVYAATTQTMQQQTESLRQPRYTKDIFIYFYCLFIFVCCFIFALFGVGIWLV